MLRTVSILTCLIISTALFSACQPSYTMDQLETIASKSGASHQFDIKRQHHFVVSPNTHVAIASNTLTDIDRQTVVNIAVTGLTPYFSNVSAISDTTTMTDAKKQARANGANYLAYISERAISIDDGKVELIINVIDVTSDNPIDKVWMKTATSLISFGEANLQDLLLKPFQAVAEDLTGTRY